MRNITLYSVLLDSSQNKKKNFFFPAPHAPRNWATAPRVIPRGSKYTQKPWEGSEWPPASELGHSF
jgi:hypothetical protein